METVGNPKCQLVMPQLHRIGAPNRPQPSSDGKISRHRFTLEEDQALKELVDKYGCSKWATIADYFTARSARQCRDRWKYYLSPEVTVGNWTLSDEMLLFAKVNEADPQWAVIAQDFPGRTAIEIRNHYSAVRFGRRGKTSLRKETTESEI
jgi:hypothetical protein